MWISIRDGMRLDFVDVYLLMLCDVPRVVWNMVKVHHLDSCMITKKL
jgi:hypothetical protein